MAGAPGRWWPTPVSRAAGSRRRVRASPDRPDLGRRRPMPRRASGGRGRENADGIAVMTFWDAGTGIATPDVPTVARVGDVDDGRIRVARRHLGERRIHLAPRAPWTVPASPGLGQRLLGGGPAGGGRHADGHDRRPVQIGQGVDPEGFCGFTTISRRLRANVTGVPDPRWRPHGGHVGGRRRCEHVGRRPRHDLRGERTRRGEVERHRRPGVESLEASPECAERPGERRRRGHCDRTGQRGATRRRRVAVDDAERARRSQRRHDDRTATIHGRAARLTAG